MKMGYKTSELMDLYNESKSQKLSNLLLSCLDLRENIEPKIIFDYLFKYDFLRFSELCLPIFLEQNNSRKSLNFHLMKYYFAAVNGGRKYLLSDERHIYIKFIRDELKSLSVLDYQEFKYYDIFTTEFNTWLLKHLLDLQTKETMENIDYSHSGNIALDDGKDCDFTRHNIKAVPLPCSDKNCVLWIDLNGSMIGKSTPFNNIKLDENIEYSYDVSNQSINIYKREKNHI